MSRYTFQMARRRPSLLTVLKTQVPERARLLVCVSGGRDSIALLHGLVFVRKALELHLEVCHLDHGFRPESYREANFVRGVSSSLEIPFHSCKLGAKPEQENLEAWARDQRYRYFREVLEDRKLDWCVTGHHADDVAETLLIRLCANRDLSNIQSLDRRRRCLRPLLLVSRSEIDTFIRERGLEFVEDPSNEDLSFTRNKIRHLLIPFLQREFGSSIVRSVAERAASLETDARHFEREVERVVAATGEVSLGDLAWASTVKTAFSSLSTAIKWRTAERLLLPILGFELGERRSRLVAACFAGDLDAVELPGGNTLHCTQNGWAIERLLKGEAELGIDDEPISINS